MTRKLVITALFLLGAALSAWGVFELARPEERFVVRADLDVAPMLNGAESSQFARAFHTRDFHFPEDHGPHPEYGVEWWYYTGNLDSPNGRHFGFELTLFRIALAPEEPERASNWATSQLYMGHFALTDVKNNRFYAFERFSREGLDLAGASAGDDGGFHVWLEDWSVEGRGARQPTVKLRAAEEDIAIDLTLVSMKPLVLQGDRGLSRKSGEPGNASYYYSITRMETTGTVSVGEESFPVAGSSWMDREWSTSALADDQVGWDWFALQLSDGRELMYYRILHRDGGVDPLTGGGVVPREGPKLPLGADDVHIRVLDHWQSPRGGSYPSQWQMQIPSRSLDLVVTPYVENQELDVSVRYWEGAVRIEGTSQGQTVTGVGYVEMTGVADRNLAELSPDR